VVSRVHQVNDPGHAANMAMWHAIVALAIYIGPALVNHPLIETKTIDEKRNCARMNQCSLGYFPAMNMVNFGPTASAHEFDHKAWVVFEIEYCPGKGFVYICGTIEFCYLDCGFSRYTWPNLLMRGPDFYFLPIYNNDFFLFKFDRFFGHKLLHFGNLINEA